MAKKEYQTEKLVDVNELMSEDYPKLIETTSKVEAVKNKILDIINDKLTGGANIDYLTGLAKIYRDLK